MNEENFNTTRGFKSYVSKAEVTGLDPSFLVKGSKNVLIDYANRVISRNGYTLYNQPSGYDVVEVASDTTFYGSAFSPGPNNTQTYMEFGGWGDQYYDFLQFPLPAKPVVATKVLLNVYLDGPSPNDAVIQVNRITAPWTGATLTRFLTPANDGVNWGSFPTTAGAAGWVQVDITALYNAWLAGTYPNYGIMLNPTQTSNQNNGTFQSRLGANPPFIEITTQQLPYGIKSSYDWETSSAPDFNLRSYGRVLEFDWNGQYNTLLTGLPSAAISFAKVLDYAEQQDVLLFVLGEQQMRRWSGGVSKAASSTAATITKQGVQTALTNIAFVAGDGLTINPTITGAGFDVAGFAAGDSLTVTGSTGNSSVFTIASVTATVITLVMSNVLVSEAAGQTITMWNQTGPTWKSARFFSSISPRALTYNGVSYTYTGGEATDTLTGLTTFPTVTAGDAVWQTPDAITLPSSILTPFPGFYPNLIGVQLNIVFLASTTSQMIFGSQNVSYVNFTLTAPRAPGDPFQQPLTSGPATCIVPVDTTGQILETQSTLVFGAGIDSFDQIDFKMSQDNSQELLRIIRYKTAANAGLISQEAICPIKGGTVYISREPALETLSQGALESPDGKKNVPVSDPIKDDFDNYDFTNCHVKYWKRAIYIALPAHGLVLIYDLMRNLWQPPQTMPISRFAIINDWLYGHSSIVNETYKLFTGTNDNGNPISQRARFAYNNGGARSVLKNMSAYWSDGYITPNGELTMSQYMGFGGSLGIKSMSILGTDQSIVTSNDSDPLGSDPLGGNPLGGAVSGETFGFTGPGATMLRFWQEDRIDQTDYIEQFVEYSMTTMDGQFAIVAHGSNQWNAGTVPVSHTK